MADYNLEYLLRKAQEGSLADNDPHLLTLERHFRQGVRGAEAALAQVTAARRGRGGDVNKLI